MADNNLSLEILHMLNLYYKNRKDQHEQVWDKQRDLVGVVHAASKDGWTVEAVAGTFWFSKPSPLGTVIVKVNENNYLTGGESNVGESLAKHPLLDWVMGKLLRR